MTNQDGWRYQQVEPMTEQQWTDKLVELVGDAAEAFNNHKDWVSRSESILYHYSQRPEPKPTDHIVDANKMVWTTEPPTEPGWYFKRLEPGFVETVVRVHRGDPVDDVYTFMEDGLVKYVVYFPGQWQGPITPDKKPEHKLNGGDGALLCPKCQHIIADDRTYKTGW